MTEREEAIKLANKVLDEPNRDPDDDLSMMSRQFLRSREIIEKQEKALQAVDWDGKAMDDLIHANHDQILRMHEEAVRRITKVLIGGGEGHDKEKLIYIGKVLHALNQFHPMHGESWIGWPE